MNGFSVERVRRKYTKNSIFVCQKFGGMPGIECRGLGFVSLVCLSTRRQCTYILEVWGKVLICLFTQKQSMFYGMSFMCQKFVFEREEVFGLFVGRN